MINNVEHLIRPVASLDPLLKRKYPFPVPGENRAPVVQHVAKHYVGSLFYEQVPSSLWLTGKINGILFKAHEVQVEFHI
jgi:hypothetical protein